MAVVNIVNIPRKKKKNENASAGSWNQDVFEGVPPCCKPHPNRKATSGNSPENSRFMFRVNGCLMQTPTGVIRNSLPPWDHHRDLDEVLM